MPAHRKLVCGRGVNDAPFTTSLKMKSYRLWNNMLSRCYGARSSSNGSYTGCEVDPRWYSYTAFMEWYDEHAVEDWDLEKDLLMSGNKMYGPDTCVFVPHYVNTAISHLNVTGHAYREGRPRPYYVISGGKYHGNFDTAAEAKACWVNMRVELIEQAITRYRLETFYDHRVETALRRVIGELQSPTSSASSPALCER